MLAKFIKILITPQANPEHVEEQKKDFNKYHQRDIFNNLVSVYGNFILHVEVVFQFFYSNYPVKLKVTHLKIS